MCFLILSMYVSRVSSSHLSKCMCVGRPGVRCEVAATVSANQPNSPVKTGKKRRPFVSRLSVNINAPKYWTRFLFENNAENC